MKRAFIGVAGAAALLAVAGCNAANTKSTGHSAALTALASEEPLCGQQELAVANGALQTARSGLDQAITAIRSSDPKHVARAREWLGLRSSTEGEGVRNTMLRTRAFANGVSWRCARQNTPEDGDRWYAYVRPDQSFVVVLSPRFFSQPPSGLDSRMGTVVHEISHFTLAGATADDAYTPNGARHLARTDPAAAQRNAENVQYFVEAVAYDL